MLSACSSVALAVAGAGAAAYAATRPGAVGDASRAAGSGVADVAAKARSLDKSHHITQRAYDTLKATASKAAEVDRKYHVTERAKSGLSGAVSRAAEMDKKYHVTDRAATGIAAGINWVRGLGGANEPPLPEGWIAMQDHSGRVYYVNELTGESQWERPSAEVPVGNLPQPPRQPWMG